MYICRTKELEGEARALQLILSAASKDKSRLQLQVRNFIFFASDAVYMRAATEHIDCNKDKSGLELRLNICIRHLCIRCIS